MSGLYVKLDVEYASDDKMIEAGPMAELLYVRSLAFCKKNSTSDGKFSRAQLAVVAVGIPAPKRLAERLVEVGAWVANDTGWEITAWLKRNRSSADIQAQQEMASAQGIQGNHDRWHTGPDGKPSSKCPICIAQHRQTRSPTPSGNPTENHRVSDRKVSPKEEEETEEKPETQEETKTKPKEKSSSSSSEFSNQPRTPEEEAGLISSALTIVAEKVARQNNALDPFAYKQTIMTDRCRRNDLERLHTQHPTFNAEQLAALHGGRELARVQAMTEPEPEPTPTPVSTYRAPPPVPPTTVTYCEGCNKPAAMMVALGCKLNPKPDQCVDVATVHHIVRGAS